MTTPPDRRAPIPDDTARDRLLAVRADAVARLRALRAEVAALRRVPERALGVSAAELLDGQPSRDDPVGANRDDVAGVVRRIDAVTATAVDALSAAGRSSGVGRERPVRS